MGATASCCTDDPSKTQIPSLDEGALLDNTHPDKPQLEQSVPSNSENAVNLQEESVPSMAVSGTSAEHHIIQPSDAISDDEMDEAAHADHGQNGYAPSPKAADDGYAPDDEKIIEVSPMPQVHAQDQHDDDRTSSVEPIEVTAAEEPVTEVPVSIDAVSLEMENTLDGMDTVTTPRAGQAFVKVSVDESDVGTSDTRSATGSVSRWSQQAILEDAKLKQLSVDLVTSSKGEFVKFVNKILKSKLKGKIWKKCDSKGTGQIDEQKFMFFWILPVTLFKVAQFQRKNKTKTKPQMDDKALRNECVHLATWIIYKHGTLQADGGYSFLLKEEGYNKVVVEYVREYAKAKGEVEL